MKQTIVSSEFSFRITGSFLVLLVATTATAQQTLTSPRPDGAQTPLRIFTPTGQSCAPLAVISPGAGGSESGYIYLAEGLRDRGYLAVVVGHKESGPATLRKVILHAGIHGGLKDMVTDSTLQTDRMLDLTAALAWSDKQCHHLYKVLLGHSMDRTPSCSKLARATSSASTATEFRDTESREKTASTPTSPSHPPAPDRSSPPNPGATSTSRSTS